MGCTKAYLQEHPCPIPWMLGDTGRCDLLIAEQISSHGPSRRILMAYTILFSFLCFVLNGQRLADALASPALQHKRHQRFGLWMEPEILKILTLLHTSVMLMLQAIDIRGYGGRLPFTAWLYLRSQVNVGLMSTFMLYGRKWYTLLAEETSTSAPTAHHRHIWWYYTAAIFIASGVVPAFQVYLRPPDAALGVMNSIVASSGNTITCVVAVAAGAVITSEYRRHATARRQSSGLHFETALLSRQLSKVVPKRTSMVHTSSNLTSIPSTRDRLRQGSLAFAASPSPQRILSRGESLKDPAHLATETHHAIPAVLTSTTSLHQLRKFLWIYWVLMATGLGLLAFEWYKARTCWKWREPPMTQWMDTSTTLSLLGLCYLTTASMKTYQLCQRVE